MFSWLKKSRKAIERDDREWTVATGMDGNFPLILRIRTTLPATIERAGYPSLLAIHWGYQPAGDQGMPATKERARMDQLEDLLYVGLEPEGQGYLTAVVTCNGTREWQWYTRDSQEALVVINVVLKGHSPFPIQISAQNDPAWTAYFDLLSLVKPDG